MRRALEGGTIDRSDPVWQMYCDYRLVRLTGWSYGDAEAAPGHICDWFLQFEQLEREMQRRHA